MSVSACANRSHADATEPKPSMIHSSRCNRSAWASKYSSCVILPPPARYWIRSRVHSGSRVMSARRLANVDFPAPALPKTATFLIGLAVPNRLAFGIALVRPAPARAGLEADRAFVLALFRWRDFLDLADAESDNRPAELAGVTGVSGLCRRSRAPAMRLACTGRAQWHTPA